MNQSTPILALFITLAGCTNKSADCTLCDTGGGEATDPVDGNVEAEDGDLSTGGDETGTADGSDEGASADQFTTAVGPCDDGGWGTITDPASTLHFWGGSDSNTPVAGTGNGEMNTPFESWAAFEAARAADPGLTVNAIGLWSGAHTISAGSFAEYALNGTPILGCGPQEVTTTLDDPGASSSSDAVLTVGDGMSTTLAGLSLSATGDQSVLQLSANGSATLSNMKLSGGMTEPVIRVEDESNLNPSHSEVTGGSAGIWTTGGTASLTLETVQIVDTHGAGIWTTGGTASLIDITILNVMPMPGITSGGSGGWGLVLRGDDIVAHNIQIDGAVRAGLVASVSGVASIRDVTVKNVTGADGAWGRGIYIEGSGASGYVNMENVTIENVFEAGLFIQDLPSADINNLTITGVHTHTSEAYGGERTNGDGFVLVQTSDTEAEVDPSEVQAQMTGTNSFTAIERAGIIAHGAALELTMPMEIDAGEMRDGNTIFTQGNGKIDFIAEEDELSGGADDEYGMGSSYESLVTECGEEDSYHLECDGFDFDSMR